MNAAEKLKHTAAMAAYDYMDKAPEENIPKLLDKLCRIDDSSALTQQASGMKRGFEDPTNMTRNLVLSLWTDVDAGERRKLYETIVVNGTLVAAGQSKAMKKKYGCNIPWLILMDPTSACNLKCTGCWAAEYGGSMSLTYAELDDIVRQGREMGCYVYMLSGGEPMVRKDDIIKLCENHPDCAFMAFTNGTLIDEAFADEMLRVGNLIPAISVEGLEADTDFRRGAGTFQRVMKAMEILKRKKLLFGASTCYTRKNVEYIGSADYFDKVIGWGAKFCWCFAYTPVGKNAVPELMITAEQRKYMYYQIRKLRAEKPLLAMDFYNDAKFVHGCIAGGRSYLHINANGDIEPCAFLHYADSNIRTDTLLQALQKPLFMAFHDQEPFNKNMLRPCPLVDNPGRLTAIVEKTGAHSTDALAPESAADLSSRCVEFAKSWAPIAKELWDKETAADEAKKAASGKS